MNLLKRIIKYFVLKKRYKFFKKYSIKNEDVTILSNCCIAGTMYNDLGLKFNSPTINLFFGHHGFVDFVKHFDEYANGELFDTGRYDINENKGHGPICLLKKQGLPDVEIHFLHYNSFKEAKEKWFSRYRRINKQKIFLVIEAKEKHEHDILNEYIGLPYPKIIFTDLETDENKSLLHMPLYDKQTDKSVTGLLGITGKRGYDNYDFVNKIFNYDYTCKSEEL